MDFDFASQPGKPDMLLGMDVNEDAIVIINAEGLIMLVSQVSAPLGINPCHSAALLLLGHSNLSALSP